MIVRIVNGQGDRVIGWSLARNGEGEGDHDEVVRIVSWSG